MRLIIATVVVIAIAALSAACNSDQATQPNQTAAENVEIFVVDKLDNIQNGYCIDIAKGKGASANPADGLQAHTCYSPLGEVAFAWP